MRTVMDTTTPLKAAAIVARTGFGRVQVTAFCVCVCARTRARARASARVRDWLWLCSGDCPLCNYACV